MDLIEILLIAFFIAIPLLEGIMKQRRKTDRPDAAPPRPPPAGAEEGGASESATELVPEDLWAVLTGERPRRREPGGGSSPEPTPWSEEPEPAILTEPEPALADGEEDWSRPREERGEPVSLEYEGPEAYSLETAPPPPLTRSVPSTEERHREFHKRIDRIAPPRPRRTSPLVRALRSPEGLRQAVLMKEVLGPPRGLE